MFLYKQALIREACLFNLTNTAHQQAYNALLGQEGRTLFIQKRKEWGVQGFIAPDMEADYDPEGPPAFVTKSDSFYVFVEYNKSPDSPWQPPNRAELYAGHVVVDGKKMIIGGNKLRAPNKHDVIDVEVEEGDDNESVLAKIDRSHVVIDISKRLEKRPVRAKKKKLTAKQAVDKAIKKGGPKSNWTKIDPKDLPATVEQMLESEEARKAKKKTPTNIATKRVSNAKTVDAKIEVVVEDLKLSVAKASKDIVKEMKGAGKQGQGDMVGYMADQLRVNPEHAKGILAKMLAEAPDRFPGVTSVDQLASKLLAMDNGVAKPAPKDDQ
jgi:hypothetical protein